MFVDEVHKYPEKYPGHDWSAEIKNVYDSFPELQLIYTGSSVLKLFRGRGDLSRRRVANHMPGLSFREFLQFMGIAGFPAISLKEVLEGHVGIAAEIAQKIKIFKWFEPYLQHGHYPFYPESPEAYVDCLKAIISVILENDIPAVTDIPYDTSVKLKKLLSVIAGSVPVTPSLTRTGLDLHIADQRTLLKYLDFLDKAELITLLDRKGKGRQILRKPEKIYLNNTNLSQCFGLLPETGMIRETFFLNQTGFAHSVTFPGQGDFMLDNRWIFEIGSRNKNRQQIQGAGNSYLALDNIETGHGQTIPLWLFGFLY